MKKIEAGLSQTSVTFPPISSEINAGQRRGQQTIKVNGCQLLFSSAENFYRV